MVLEFDDAPEASSGRKVSLIRMGIGLLILFVVALILFTIYSGSWQFKQVVSNSMLPTLKKGEYVFVDSRPQASYDHNDVVMIVDPLDPEGFAVKRVIAVEGETVEWSDGELTIDGATLSQPTPENLGADWRGEYVKGMPGQPDVRISVGPGQVFVVGDNWGSSYDSFEFGPLNVDQIKGIVRSVYWPLNSRRPIE